MTHPIQTNNLDQIRESLDDKGFDGTAVTVNVLLNEIENLERSPASGAVPFQRTEE